MNGPGWDFGRLVVKEFHYPFYYRHKTSGEITIKTTKKYGWHSNPKRKYELLSLYNRMLAQGGYANPSIPALEEAKLYVEYENERIESVGLTSGSDDEKKAHGDRVIADALTLEEKDMGKRVTKRVAAPRNSFAYRYEKAMKQRKIDKISVKNYQHRYDFSCVG